MTRLRSNPLRRRMTRTRPRLNSVLGQRSGTRERRAIGGYLPEGCRDGLSHRHSVAGFPAVPAQPIAEVIESRWIALRIDGSDCGLAECNGLGGIAREKRGIGSVREERIPRQGQRTCRVRCSHRMCGGPGPMAPRFFKRIDVLRGFGRADRGAEGEIRPPRGIPVTGNLARSLVDGDRCSSLERRRERSVELDSLAGEQFSEDDLLEQGVPELDRSSAAILATHQDPAIDGFPEDSPERASRKLKATPVVESTPLKTPAFALNT